MLEILATWEAGIGRTTVGDQRGQIKFARPPISKITRAKWTGDAAQLVDHLLCKVKF
jgi:hypothetical protein